MDIGGIIARGIELALDTTDGVLSDVTYDSAVVGAYDVATDTTTTTVTTVVLRTLVYNITEDEKTTLYPKTAEAGYLTKKLLLPTTRLNGIVPNLEDKVTIASEVYEVKKVNTVPGGSLYIVYVSKAS